MQEHASAFGGDPDCVTIFGESAGGMSVGALLGTPAAHGTYHRAIAQSGAMHNVSSREAAARMGHRGEGRPQGERERRGGESVTQGQRHH